MARQTREGGRFHEELRAGAEPAEVFRDGRLIDSLKKAVAERALDTEMAAHLLCNRFRQQAHGSVGQRGAVRTVMVRAPFRSEGKRRRGCCAWARVAEFVGTAPYRNSPPNAEVSPNDGTLGMPRGRPGWKQARWWPSEVRARGAQSIAGYRMHAWQTAQEARESKRFRSVRAAARMGLVILLYRLLSVRGAGQVDLGSRRAGSVG